MGSIERKRKRKRARGGFAASTRLLGAREKRKILVKADKLEQSQLVGQPYAIALQIDAKSGAGLFVTPVPMSTVKRST